jgi:mannobiose 2-epimerase
MEKYADELLEELTGNILPFWVAHGRDVSTGGFYGALGNDNIGDRNENRSIVMTSRHLWTYSAAARFLNNPAWLAAADYAYAYLTGAYCDKANGGVYWSVSPDGTPNDPRKQIYGEAFAIYGLAEYACAQHDRGDAAKAVTVLDVALSIFDLLEQHAYDPEHGGYCEALDSNWRPITKTKLSAVDIDCDKSMNTNLHVLEAFTGLLRAVRRIRPGTAVHKALEGLIIVVTDRIFGPDAHLDLFFTRDWTVMNDIISFGHDIEASWLLWEAAEEVGNEALKQKVLPLVIRVAETALQEGFDVSGDYGALENEIHGGSKGGKRDRTRIWWCQAEAMVGFYNAWQLTGEDRYRDAAIQEWSWIKRYQKDPHGGDWFWAVSSSGIADTHQLKGGNWKTPYHNARSCMELLRRIGQARCPAVRHEDDAMPL